jgi:hypothetical protein
VDVNHRLADPPVTDLATGRMLGFFVVGQLIRRHGLKVQLRHSWYGGITALVRLPNELLQTTAPDWAPNGPKPAAIAEKDASRRPPAAPDPDLQGPERPSVKTHMPLQRHPSHAQLGTDSRTIEQRQPG